ncbi:hypothetical protein KVR01_010990 [Diaporthe batatas]|uniref:uncharacterized protein n=1 Tax=Diaporthe batatas TaxID=748121 RepID=UPI001D0561B3|nr:uncharacterized protein KVR01_010990 [Diaporthe batatas]KAG8159329.1 hypothetical protein KVR01_010990 [Diaporthe batatas]
MASSQDKVQHYLGQLDKELSKYPALQNLEKQTSVPKTYAVIGAVTLYFFFIVFNLGGQLLTNLAGFAIPGYYSLNALFTSSKTDDTQWLTYWVVFSFFTVLESLLSVVYWFPFYYTFKFVFLLWLALPTFRYVLWPPRLSVALEDPSDSVIGVPKSSSALSWPPHSAVTSAALPLLACVLRPTRPSKQLAPRDLPTNRGRAWPLKASKGHLLGSESARMKPLCP